jgi:probable phosphoglycerate mutase
MRAEVDAKAADFAVTQNRRNTDVSLTTSHKVRAKVCSMRYDEQRVYLIRHGETEWSISRRHTGTTDIPLTPNGRAAAKLLAPVLAEQQFAVVLVSPLRRARQTCELAALDARATIETDLCEWNYGQYEGLTPAQIRATAPDWLIFRDGCPGGESPAEVGARVDRLIDRIRTIAGHVALFGHGHLLRVLASRWIGSPVSCGAHFLLHPASLSVLGYYQGRGAIERWNARVAP